jgi:hypothetical protein
LKQVGNGIWEVDEDLSAREKVSHTFRTTRSSLKKKQQDLPTREAELEEQQGNFKRPKQG